MFFTINARKANQLQNRHARAHSNITQKAQVHMRNTCILNNPFINRLNNVPIEVFLFLKKWKYTFHYHHSDLPDWLCSFLQWKSMWWNEVQVCQKTWPTFLMKVLTCMEMLFPGRSAAQMAYSAYHYYYWIWVLWRFSSCQAHIVVTQAQLHPAAKRKKPQIFMVWSMGRCERGSVSLSAKFGSLANFSSLYQTTSVALIKKKEKKRSERERKVCLFILHCCLATLGHTLALPFPVTTPPILHGNWFPARPSNSHWFQARRFGRGACQQLQPFERYWLKTRSQLFPFFSPYN